MVILENIKKDSSDATSPALRKLYSRAIHNQRRQTSKSKVQWHHFRLTSSVMSLNLIAIQWLLFSSRSVPRLAFSCRHVRAPSCFPLHSQHCTSCAGQSPLESNTLEHQAYLNHVRISSEGQSVYTPGEQDSKPLHICPQALVHAHGTGTILRGLTSPHSVDLNETSYHGRRKYDSYNYRYNKQGVDMMRAY